MGSAASTDAATFGGSGSGCARFRAPADSRRFARSRCSLSYSSRSLWSSAGSALSCGSRRLWRRSPGPGTRCDGRARRSSQKPPTGESLRVAETGARIGGRRREPGGDWGASSCGASSGGASSAALAPASAASRGCCSALSFWGLPRPFFGLNAARIWKGEGAEGAPAEARQRRGGAGIPRGLAPHRRRRARGGRDQVSAAPWAPSRADRGSVAEEKQRRGGGETCTARQARRKRRQSGSKDRADACRGGCSEAAHAPCSRAP